MSVVVRPDGRVVVELDAAVARAWGPDLKRLADSRRFLSSPVPVLEAFLDELRQVAVLNDLADCGNEPLVSSSDASRLTPVGEAARMLGVPVRTLRYRCGRPGRVPGAVKVAGCWLVPVDYVTNRGS